MQPPTQPLSSVVDITVSVSAQSAAPPSFNQGLIIGTSTVIPSSTRIQQYSSLAAISSAGFSLTSPEYLAAELYFGQNPPPQTVWIGRQDLTAIATATIDAGGAGYVVGDVITVVQAGGSLGTLTVTTVTSGAITGLTVLNGGTGYAVGTAVATSGGTGTGATINIVTVGETPLQAATACRLANPNWYGFMVCGAAKADHLAIGAWVQAATPQSLYVFSTSDTDVPTGATTNVFYQLQNLKYNRTWGLYSTTQAGAYPNNAYAAAAMLGVLMGQNTGLANSFFTTKFKVLSGVATEPLTATQIGTIESQNGNVYLSIAGQYSWLEQGVVSNGQFVDEIMNLDMLSADMQYSVINLLVAAPSVPQNENGETLLMNVVGGACQRAVTRGFLSAGVWEGQTVLNLTAGTNLPKGYLIQSQPYSQQSSADHAARKAMPIYASIYEAGAVHSVTIGVSVSL